MYEMGDQDTRYKIGLVTSEMSKSHLNGKFT